MQLVAKPAFGAPCGPSDARRARKKRRPSTVAIDQNPSVAQRGIEQRRVRLSRR
jgi:hypothetical protein